MTNTVYYLQAQVDKIQTFIFQSSKLKEVVGASFMLSKFGQNLHKKLGIPERDVILKSGGNFRIRCDSEDEVIRLGHRLKQAFEQEIGGSITISEPSKGNERPKAERLPHEPLWHMPFQAICASCGVNLAISYGSRYTDEADNYICQTCQRKAEGSRRSRRELFNDLWRHLGMGLAPDVEQPSDAEAYAWDERNYVAYLAADGNGMGEIFGALSQNQAKLVHLSKHLGDITAQALAEAIGGLGHFIPEDSALKGLPVLPLILGGDDVFMLMPAPWALHVAAIFCQTYEELMSAFLKDEIGLDIRATIGAAVVVCKASYPYKAAHTHAEELLAEVKREAKQRGQSMLTVDLITGSDAVWGDARHQPQSYTVDEARLLLNQRLEQTSLASTRRERMRAALQAHFQTGATIQEGIYPADWATLQIIAKALAEDVTVPSRTLDLFNLWDYLMDLSRSRTEYGDSDDD